MIAPTQTTTENEDRESGVRPQPCPSCRGLMLVLTDEFTCLERCFSCQRSSLVAWASCQPVLRLASR